MPANEAVHWIEPKLVAEVTFTGWTNEPHLRHAVHLGLRDDVDPRSITLASARVPESKATETSPSAARRADVARHAEGQGRHQGQAGVDGGEARGRVGPGRHPHDAGADALIAKLQDMEDAKKDGTVTLPGGETLEVTNLRKVFWPVDGYTKGDLLRFYARVSPWLLPVVAERPLVMKRFPNGVNGKAFYQQKAPDVVPPGIRVEDTVDDEGADTITRRLVGGDLKTLLYMAQLGTISQDPWFSRYDTPHAADYVALDLDPMPGVPFSQVLDVARWVRDELERLGVPGVPKTSGLGAPRLHSAARRHVLRSRPAAVRDPGDDRRAQAPQRSDRRADGRQARAHRLRRLPAEHPRQDAGDRLLARASEFGGVSTPLTWDEVDEGVSPGDFTIKTAPARFAAMPDLWKPVIAGPPVDLHGVLEAHGARPRLLIAPARARRPQRRPAGAAGRYSVPSRRASISARSFGRPAARLFCRKASRPRNATS